MTEVTLATLGHNADGSVREGSITVDPAAASNPKPKPRPAPPLLGTVILSRVTDAEYAGVLAAAQAQLATGNAQLQRWLDILRINGTVDLASPDTQTAKTALVSAHLLTQARADIIFAP